MINLSPKKQLTPTKMKNNLIFLSALLFSTISFSQTERQITGKITDLITQSPIKGAAILAKGTIIGTTSKAQGEYSIKVPNDITHLIFKYAGYEKQEIEIDSRKMIDVQLINNESLEIEDFTYDEWKQKIEQIGTSEKEPRSPLAQEVYEFLRLSAEVERLEQELERPEIKKNEAAANPPPLKP